MEILVEPLRKNRLLIATPCYGANLNMSCSQSVMKLRELLMQAGIAHEIRYLGNESLIPRARNILTQALLESDYTHILFIDSDIQFDARDVFMMLHLDKEVIGASYPMKGIDWAQVKEVVLKHPEIPPEELASAGARWPIHFFEGTQTAAPYVPIEVYEVATGFLLIKREVFEKLKATAPAYEKGFHEEHAGDPIYDFFPVGVRDKRYESEDYGFCRLWKEAGGKIWLCPWIELIHWGTYGFRGNLYRALELLNKDNLFKKELTTQ